MNDFMVDSLDRFVGSLEELLDELRRRCDDLAGSDNTEELLRSVVITERVRKMAADVHKEIHDKAAEKLEPTAESVRVAGAFCEVRDAAPRKSWDHLKAKGDVAGRIADLCINFDTGEVVMSTEEAVMRALNVCGTGYWKVGEMGNIGLDANSYCEVGEPKRKVSVRFDAPI